MWVIQEGSIYEVISNSSNVFICGFLKPLETFPKLDMVLKNVTFSFASAGFESSFS